MSLRDDTTSKFIHMLIDRIGNLEAKVDKLLANNEKTCPDLFLRPDTDTATVADCSGAFLVQSR